MKLNQSDYRPYSFFDFSEFDILYRRTLAIAVSERGFASLLPDEPFGETCKMLQFWLLRYISHPLGLSSTTTCESPDAIKRAAKDKFTWLRLEEVFEQGLEELSSKHPFDIVYPMLMLMGPTGFKLFTKSKISEIFVRILMSNQLHRIERVFVSVSTLLERKFHTEDYFIQLHHLQFFEATIRFWSAGKLFQNNTDKFDCECWHDPDTECGESLLLRSIQFVMIALTFEAVFNIVMHDLRSDMLKSLRKLREHDLPSLHASQLCTLTKQISSSLSMQISAPETQRLTTRRLGLPQCTKCDRRASMTEKFKICSRCRHVRYCSVKCQSDDWKKHERVCKK